MADEQLISAPIETQRTIGLMLDPQGGRVFAHHAKADRLDHQIIELKCQWVDERWFDGDNVVIGDERHPWHSFFADEEDDEDGDGRHTPKNEEIGWRLNSLPIMLSIYQVDEKWFAESLAGHDGASIAGRFSYNPKINTSDGAVDDKWPSCSAWIGVGPGIFKLIRDRVIDYQKYDFKVGIDVLFPANGVERGWAGRKIQWDGEDQLPIMSAVVVWQRDDWRREIRRELFPQGRRQAEQEYVAPREHREMLEATSRVETAVAKLTTPMWVAAGLIMIFLIFRH